jgi:hypothetical protein
MSVAAFDALRARGHVASTPVPSAHGVGVSRTPLFDVHDLDAAIERWKAEGVS